MIKLILTFIRREILKEKIYKFQIMARIAEGLIKILIFYFIGKYLEPSYFSYVFVGIVFGRTLYFFASLPTDFIKHEQHWGTLGAVIASPRDFLEIIISYSAARTAVFYFIEMAAYLLGGMSGGFLKGYGTMSIVRIFFNILPYWAVSAVLFWAGGLVMAALALKVKKIEQSLWFAVSAIEIMSGVYFPPGNLPNIFFLKKISPILPTTHILTQWRAVMINNGWLDGSKLAVYMLWAAVSLVISIVVFRKVFVSSLKNGDVLNY